MSPMLDNTKDSVGESTVWTKIFNKHAVDTHPGKAHIAVVRTFFTIVAGEAVEGWPHDTHPP